MNVLHRTGSTYLRKNCQTERRGTRFYQFQDLTCGDFEKAPLLSLILTSIYSIFSFFVSLFTPPNRRLASHRSPLLARVPKRLSDAPPRSATRWRRRRQRSTYMPYCRPGFSELYPASYLLRHEHDVFETPVFVTKALIVKIDDRIIEEYINASIRRKKTRGARIEISRLLAMTNMTFSRHPYLLRKHSLSKQPIT